MRLPVALLAAALVAGCGGDDDGGPAPTSRAGAAPGLKVWVAQGCGSCHTLKAGGSTSDVGPNLDASLIGKSRAYVIESIVAPVAEAAEGYEDRLGMMPDDYGTRIARADLERLADFILPRR